MSIFNALKNFFTKMVGASVTGHNIADLVNDASEKYTPGSGEVAIPALTIVESQIVSENPYVFQLTDEQAAIVDGDSGRAIYVVLTIWGTDATYEAVFLRAKDPDASGVVYFSSLETNENGGTSLSIAYAPSLKQMELSNSSIHLLPNVTSAQNGKVLMVVDGDWEVRSLPTATD